MSLGPGDGVERAGEDSREAGDCPCVGGMLARPSSVAHISPLTTAPSPV